jgi:HEAT repeat protein
MLELFRSAQRVLEPVVFPLILVLGGLVLLVSLTYISLAIRNTWKERKIKKIRPALREHLAKYIELDEDVAKLERTIDGYREVFRDELISSVSQEKFPREDLETLYTSHGFLAEDEDNLSSPRWYERLWALERLKLVDADLLEGRLDELIRDPSLDVRLSAVGGLARTERVGELDLREIFDSFDERNHRFLFLHLLPWRPERESLESLARSQPAQLRTAGAVLAGQPGNVKLVPFLEELSTDDNSAVRREVARSLGRIGTKEALEPLREMAKVDLPSVRRETAASLGNVPENEALVPLKTLADDPNFRVRLAAFLALVHFGEPGRNIATDYWNEHRRLARETVFESYQR